MFRTYDPTPEPGSHNQQQHQSAASAPPSASSVVNVVTEQCGAAMEAPAASVDKTMSITTSYAAVNSTAAAAVAASCSVTTISLHEQVCSAGLRHVSVFSAEAILCMSVWIKRPRNTEL